MTKWLALKTHIKKGFKSFNLKTKSVKNNQNTKPEMEARETQSFYLLLTRSYGEYSIQRYPGSL